MPPPPPPPSSPPPRFHTSWFNSIYQLGPRPLVATGWFRLWLTNHFSNPDNFEDAGLASHLIWKPDRTSQVAIESVTNWKPELVETHPAVIIKRNDWTRLRLGIDDRMMGTTAVDGIDRYATYWQGSHSLFCIANEGAEAEKLAAEVYREMNQFGKVIRRILCLMRFEISRVGALRTLQDARKVFVVPIDVGYIFEETFKLIPPANKLAKIDLAFFTP